jgi:hypothetical protein
MSASRGKAGKPRRRKYIKLLPKLPCRYLYFDVVVGLVWSCDAESYAGGSIATGRVSHAR